MSANTEAQGSGRGTEAMKWVVVVALLTVAIVGNYLYRDIMLPLRALAVVILIAAAGGVALLTTKVKQPLLLPVKRVPKSVRSFGRLAGNIAHHADCGCGYRSNVTDPMGTGWYSGSPGILYHWPEVLRCLKLLKALVRRSGVFRF